MFTMRTTIKENARRMLKPLHPGMFLRTEVIEAHNLTMSAAAKIPGVARPTLSSLPNARASLSGEMGLRFEKAFGIDMETLLRMQNTVDIAETRSRVSRVHVKRFKPGQAA